MPSGVFTLKQVDLALTQGAWTNQPPNSLNYLVVAGGGGGGGFGGGGAGGVLQGSIPIASGSSLTVTVGGGGSGSGSGSTQGTTGSNSVFGAIATSGGGGGGAFSSTSSATNGLSGGSGGGSGSSSSSPFLAGIAGSGTSGQGNAGGTAAASGGGTGGGGGGAGTVGLNANGITNPFIGGNGGAGVASDISGTRTTYAGGGGGGGGDTAGVGGAGGGGTGTVFGGASNTSGSSNTGSGGGGGYNTAGSAGGSGVVIVSYPGTTQWFTGGTLSYGNGNIVHSFYSSGTLAPTTPSQYVDTGYQISRSLRFNSADSAYLTRTPGSASNRKTWTWSGWVKRSGLASDQTLFEVFNGNNDNQTFNIAWTSGNLLSIGAYNVFWLQTTPVYRDPSAWYHIVCAVDTTQAVANNRIRIYVNGVEVTAFGTRNNPSQNADLAINQSAAHYIGARNASSIFLSGYMTEVNFIDGQALTPQSFGYYNPDTGVWSPLKFVGTYGTNGFYLNFSDNSNTTAATLGKDYSGNGNNWTPNNFSVTAGAGNDSLVDSPTAYGTDTGAGGTVRGNYCTLNAVDNNLTLANGNLQFDRATASWASARATTGISSGKWYWEVTPTANSGTLYCMAGIALNSATLTDYFAASSTGWAYSAHDGGKYNNATFASYGVTWTTNDVIGVAFDADAGTLTFYKNNVSQGTAYTGLTSGPYIPAVSLYGTQTAYVNFGQRPFAYTAPSGFKALCTQNLPTPTIGATTATQAGKFFNPVLYTGTQTTQSVTGVGFQPDFTWIKDRTTAWTNVLTDAVRGAGKSLYSNSTDAEVTNDSNGYLSAFNSDGFTLAGGLRVNASGDAIVAWNWKANGAGSSNTAGSITSTVSANTTSGCSIVTFTGTGSQATVGHGLGVAPALIIGKKRSATANWFVYHASVGASAFLYLNTTDASISSTGAWGGVTPTSTVFTAGAGFNDANGATYVAYCFAPVAGFSAFGSYTGNGSSDGPFVFTGFRPAYVLVKSTAGVRGWGIFDTARGTFNVNSLLLEANTSGSEFNSASYQLDMLSNGFKIRTANQYLNSSGDGYIFAAFASSPFKYTTAF